MRSKPKKPEILPSPDRSKPEESVSRRDVLVRCGCFSAAVVGIAAGAALPGCGGSHRRGGGGDDDDTSNEPLCSESCTYAGDGDCDDGGDGSSYSVCDLGTDCTDCGVRNGGGGYADAYSNAYSNSYSDYSNSYSDYYYNYADYYSDYYNYYDNYFSNSW